MNREAMQQLRLDRRLINRRGWINKTDLAKALEALPDVSHKVAEDDEASEAGAGASAASGEEAQGG